MSFAMLRLSAVLLIVAVALPARPDAAERLNKADADAFQMFRHSIVVRLNARLCERDVPAYGERFGDLYAAWSAKHRAEIGQGESLFKEGRKVKDPKRYPYLDHTILARLEAGLAELSQAPKATGPTPSPAQAAVACERLLAFLKQN
jgi:hypothetical protein